MNNNISFSERYTSVFQSVCRILGNGWKVNMTNKYDHRIVLFTPNLKKFTISIRIEKERLIIVGSVDSRVWRSPSHLCTVSAKRDPAGIARDIKTKILPTAVLEVEEASLYENERDDVREHKKIVLNMLSKLVELTPHNNSLTGIKTEHGLRGVITEHGDGYRLQCSCLSTEQLIKMIGFMTSV